MKKSKKIYVLYHPGSYGSWVRWLIEYCNDIGHHYKFIPNNPIMTDGTSHSMFTLPNAHPVGITEILATLDETVYESCGYKVYRACPVTVDSDSTDAVLAGLLKDKDSDDKLIYIDVDSDYNKAITYLNIELKTPWKNTAFHIHDKAKNWNKTKQNFFDLERWEQRELLSIHYPEMIESLTQTPSINDEELLVVKMSSILSDDVINLARKIIEHCDLPLKNHIDAELRKSHLNMISNQKSLKIYDDITNVVEACIARKNIDIPDLTLFAESMIQKLLRDKGLEIRCYSLNEFPKTTVELIKLIN
jgi:hypothetical protein